MEREAAEKLIALNKLLARCQHAPFYRERIPSRPLQSLAEFKQIPLLTKEELRRHSPYGFLTVPRAQTLQYHETFGTTGVPVSVWFTREDLQQTVRQLHWWGVRFHRDDVVLVRYPYAISGIAHMVHRAAQAKLACVIPASSRSTISPFPRMVNLMQKLEVTVLAGLPLQALLIAETAELMGFNPQTDFPSLRALCTAGEPLPPGRRRLLETIWGVPVFDNYGMTEIGVAMLDCEFGQSHPLDEDFLFEVLAEDLQTEVPPGEIGYLVVTTLKREATPMLRLLTGDRVRLVERECACGRTITMKVHGRQEETLQVGTRRLDLWDFDAIVSALPCRRFWAVGPIPGGLRFVVEAEQAEKEIDRELTAQLARRFQLALEFEVVPKGTLFDRRQLLDLGVVGKPRYIYTAEELAAKQYCQTDKL